MFRRFVNSLKPGNEMPSKRMLNTSCKKYYECIVNPGRPFHHYCCLFFQSTLYQTKIKHCACKSPNGVDQTVEAHVVDNNGKTATCVSNVLVSGKIRLFTQFFVHSVRQLYYQERMFISLNVMLLII